MLKQAAMAIVLAVLPLAAAANGPAACGPRLHLVQQLANKYGERQVAMGLAANGQVMELFASADQEWTLVASRPDGISCIVAAGAHLTFVPLEPAPSTGSPS